MQTLFLVNKLIIVLRKYNFLVLEVSQLVRGKRKCKRSQYLLQYVNVNRSNNQLFKVSTLHFTASKECFLNYFVLKVLNSTSCIAKYNMQHNMEPRNLRN